MLCKIMSAIVDAELSPETPVELLDRIRAVLSAMPTPQATARLLPHLEWQLNGILGDIRRGDLLPAELLVLVAVLVPAHSRILVGRQPRQPTPFALHIV